MNNSCPFFIVGCERSGTTLLRLMLNAHPRICVPPESHFIVDLARNGGEVLRDVAWKRLSEHPRFLEWQLPIEAVRDCLPDQSQKTDWATVFDAVFRAAAQQAAKQRWGDKTPGYVRHMAAIANMFPESQFIHIIRDGRDVVRSLQSMEWHHKTVAESSIQWLRDFRAGRACGRELGERYLEVRFEELVQQPEPTLRSICSFLNEEFEPECLTYFENAQDHIPEHRQRWHKNTVRPPTGEVIGLWREDLHKRDIDMCHLIMRRDLRELDYPVPPWSPRLLLAAVRQWRERLLGLVSARINRSRTASRLVAAE